MNDSQCSYGIKLFEMKDFSLCNWAHNVSGLLGAIPHKVLCAPVLIVRVVQTTVGSVTMISSVISTQLSRLKGVSTKWEQSSNRYYTVSLIHTIGVRVNHLPLLLLLLNTNVDDMLTSGCNKFLDQLGVLKNFSISWASI